MNDDLFDKYRISTEEKDLRLKISRAYLSLETRITIDHFLNHAGAKLVSPQGRSIDVHPNTMKSCLELKYLIFEYTKAYGKNDGLEELGGKWTILRGIRISIDDCIIYFPS